MTEKAKDQYKYEKIYQKKGKLLKVRGGVPQELNWESANEQFKNLWSKYGAGDGNYKNELTEIHSLKPESILDVGCGWNSFCKSMKEHVEKAVGVDFACPGADVMAPAHNLPFEDKSFDLLTSWDCMEHIPEEEVPLAIKEFARVSNRIYLKITTAPSATRIDGEELHVCVKNHQWWNDEINKHFKVQKSTFKENKGKPAKNHVIVYATAK